MFSLPNAAQILFQEKLPAHVHRIPDLVFIQQAVYLTDGLRTLAPELTMAATWKKFRAFVGEKTRDVAVGSLYIQFYENGQSVSLACTQFSWMKAVARILTREARRNPSLSYLVKPIAELSAEEQGALKGWLATFLPRGEDLKQLFRTEALDDMNGLCEKANTSKLTPKQQQRREFDSALLLCVALASVHNVISLLAYGESMTTLFQKAISGSDVADDAMCKAVRVDRTLRKHPVFQARCGLANDLNENTFLARYNNNEPPLPSTAKHPSGHLLVAALDGYGYLNGLTDSQLLDLYDLSHESQLEGRVSDVGGMAKVRRLYLERKHSGKSTQQT